MIRRTTIACRFVAVYFLVSLPGISRAQFESGQEQTSLGQKQPAGAWRTFVPDPRLGRILKKALDTEIAAGKAANILLPLLLRIQGPSVPLEANVLEKINVTAGRQASSLGALKNLPRRSWPLSLRGQRQRSMVQLLELAVKETVQGTLDSERLDQVKQAVQSLQEDNRKKFHRSEIIGGTYLQAKRFLDDLEGAVRLLGQAEAAQFLDGTLAAKGRTVEELVKHMAKQGLRFAPASPGHERAYAVLHQAMVEYASGAEEDITAILAAHSRKRVKTAKGNCRKGYQPQGTRQAPAVFVWVGGEDLAGYGRLEFRCSRTGQAVMIDAHHTVPGYYVQRGAYVTLTFPGRAVYSGIIQGGSMSGTARDNTRVWNWQVTYQGE